jgi:flavin-dependent dehydrogenase
MAEPFARKGVGVAMIAAFSAMPTIIKAHKQNDFSKEVLSSYQDVIMNKFEKEWDALYKYIPLLSKKIVKWAILKLCKVRYINNLHAKDTARRFQKFIFPKGYE